MAGKTGRMAKLYRNTGTYAEPEWTEVTLARDVTLNLSKSDADSSTRGSTFEETLDGLISASVSVQLKYTEDSDGDVVAFEDAFYSGDTIDCAVMSGPIETAGSRGLRAEMRVSEFNRNEALNDTMTADATLKPSGKAANSPSKMVVTE